MRRGRSTFHGCYGKRTAFVVNRNFGPSWTGRPCVGTDLRVARRLDEARRHARDLAPAVSEMLAALAWKPGMIDAVIISRGPGSYTGLRVGIMSAKTFAFATECVLLSIDTFAEIALQARPMQERSRCWLAMHPARENLYTILPAHGRRGPADARSPLSIEAFSDWKTRLSADSFVTGPGLRLYRDQLRPLRSALPKKPMRNRGSRACRTWAIPASRWVNRMMFGQ